MMNTALRKFNLCQRNPVGRGPDLLALLCNVKKELKKNTIVKFNTAASILKGFLMTSFMKEERRQ